MIKAIYRGCAAFKDWSERMKFKPLVSLAKLAVTAVSRIVRAP